MWGLNSRGSKWVTDNYLNVMFKDVDDTGIIFGDIFVLKKYFIILVDISLLEY